MEKEQLEKELKNVIYIYADGSKYEMLDVQNYKDNLQVIGGLLATRSYIKMKPVNWKIIK